MESLRFPWGDGDRERDREVAPSAFRPRTSGKRGDRGTEWRSRPGHPHGPAGDAAAARGRIPFGAGHPAGEGHDPRRRAHRSR